MAQTHPEQVAEQLASDIRHEHGLGSGPIGDMFEFASHTCGVDVLSLDAPSIEHGASMTDPQSGRTALAVATTNSPMRQRSSIAHEIGHFLAGHLEGPAGLPIGTRSPEEKVADAFARHLLLPQQWLRDSFRNGPPQLEDLSRLVQDFGVSPHLAAIQLRRTGLIDEETCVGWGRITTRQLAGQYGWLQQYEQMVAASGEPRAPQQLMTRAVVGYRAGLVPLAELAGWYGNDPADLEELLGPPGQPADPEPAEDDGDDEYWSSFMGES